MNSQRDGAHGSSQRRTGMLDKVSTTTDWQVGGTTRTRKDGKSTKRQLAERKTRPRIGEATASKWQEKAWVPNMRILS
jgi:hypothetical protein